MKITHTSAPKRFKAFELKVKIESKKDLDTLFKFTSFDCSVPSEVFGTSEQEGYKILQDFMIQLRKQLIAATEE